MSTDWDRRYLDLAATVAAWSKDPSSKVGAAIVRPDKTIASVGFNGFPRGVADHATRYEDRSVKYPFTVHAEVNAILAAQEPLHGYTLYVTPLHPCASCAGAIIQAGIARVVSTPSTKSTAWDRDSSLAQTMFREAGVTVAVIHSEETPQWTTETT